MGDNTDAIRQQASELASLLFPLLLSHHEYRIRSPFSSPVSKPRPPGVQVTALLGFLVAWPQLEQLRDGPFFLVS